MMWGPVVVRVMRGLGTPEEIEGTRDDVVDRRGGAVAVAELAPALVADQDRPS